MKINHRRIRLKIFVSLLLLFAQTSPALAEVYKPPVISYVSTQSVYEGVLELEGKSIEVSITYQTTNGMIDQTLFRSHSPEYIKTTIYNSWNLLRRYMTERGISTTDCRFDYNLNIFILNKSVLDNIVRHDGYVVNGSTATHGIDGLYDPTPKIPKESAIMLANITDSVNDIVFYHEMSHYWFDRLCVARTVSDTEQFALSFERYYRRTR